MKFFGPIAWRFKDGRLNAGDEGKSWIKTDQKQTDKNRQYQIVLMSL